MTQNFCQKILSQAKENPGKVILHLMLDGIYHDVTYSELITGARKFENILINSKIEAGEVVILILPHGFDLVFAYFGAILNGCIPSIMPYLTEKLIPEKYRNDLQSLVSISKPAAIITYNDFKGEISFLDLENTSVRSVIISEEINSDAANYTKYHNGNNRKETDVVLLQHSSGTTGLQKGVALSHKAVFNQLEIYKSALDIEATDVIVSWLPLYHDMGLIAGFLLPLLYGIPLVLISPFDWVRAPYRLFQAISQFHGTLCWLPNFAYNFCAKKIRDRDLEKVDLKTIKAFINCSEPMRFSSHKMFFDRFSPYGLRNNALATCYAMAENVFAVTQSEIQNRITYDQIDKTEFQENNRAVLSEDEENSIIMVSAGMPLPNVEVKIIDEKGSGLQDRSLGEIVIKSDCMLNGYYNREEETEKAFIDGWFKTGDLGYIADKELYISGRKKDLIIVGGKNIYPKDLETITMEVEGVYPGRVVAFGIYNEIKGTEDVVIIAEANAQFIENQSNIAEEIRRKVTQESAIALRNVLIVDKKWLIKTSSGKIARALNKEKYIKEYEINN